MGKFTLSDVHLVGNERLDAQHKDIMIYLAEIHAHLLDEGKGRELYDLLKRLETNCMLHFLNEEDVMEEMDLLEISEHMAEHAAFIRQLRYFSGRYEENN